MKKRILTLAVTLALVAALVVPMAALATNEAGQAASTSQATTILIVGHSTDVGVTTITFPAGLPSATISAPYNSDNGSGNPQVLHASASKPVVRLKNTSGGTLTVWLEITSWTGGANRPVVSEDFELVPVGTTTITVVDDVLSTDGLAATVNTGVTITNGEYKALYLEVVLSALAGKSGTSTLTILGESP